jgi:tetratricopeptide (TPR) repeat protein
LTLAGESFEKFPSNDVIQYNYAKCLLINGFYSESLSILENAVIMPFEGASFGRITYRQAAVMEGLQYLKENKPDRAIKSIDKARLWPENLGVGRPYNADVRIEDFVEAICLLQINESEKALSLFNNIVTFTRSGKGSYNSTDILYIFSLRHLGKNDQADSFLKQWQQNSKDDPVLNWTREMLRTDLYSARELERVIGDIIKY